MKTTTPLKVAIPTCVYPAGLKRLLDSIFAAPPAAGPVEIVVAMDGNRDYLPLWAMPEYAERFAQVDTCAGNVRDVDRMQRDNGDVQDYSFLREYEAKGVRVIRNATNLGAINNFNVLLDAVAESDFVALIMDDEFVLPGWFDWPLEVFRRFPSVVLAGYEHARPGGIPKVWDDLPTFSDLMSCAFLRGVYVRELWCHRGRVFNPEYRMVGGDVYLLHEIYGRGHGLATIAHPKLVGDCGHHKSLGRWQFENVMHDNNYAKDTAVSAPILRRGAHHVVCRMSAKQPIIEEWKEV